MIVFGLKWQISLDFRHEALDSEASHDRCVHIS
jgi:hypothetical protein